MSLMNLEIHNVFIWTGGIEHECHFNAFAFWDSGRIEIENYCQDRLFVSYLINLICMKPKDDPEGWYGEGGGRRVQDGEHMRNKGIKN